MTYTVETLHVGDGVTTQFGLDFVYQDPTHIRVSVNGVGVGYTAVSPAVVQVLPAPAAGSTVRVYRETPIANLNHSFQLGAPFLPAYVDANNLQSLYGVQESRNLSEKAVAAAGSAVDAADVANSTAAAAVGIANVATSTANNASVVARAANVTANAANTTANNAVATANSARTTANSAAATANAASSAASSAVSTANAASAAAASATATADTASTAAATAVSTANAATATANAAASTADTALGVANAAAADAAIAVQTADSAAAVAGGVDAKAQTALDTAEQAELKANEAIQAVSAAGVASFNGRSGTVLAAAGDYSADMISRGGSTVAADLAAVEASTTALQTSKADANHTHPLEDVVGLPTIVDNIAAALGTLDASLGTLDQRVGAAETALGATVVRQTAANGAAQLPLGLSGTRPANPANGQIRYNISSGGAELYSGGEWQLLWDRRMLKAPQTVLDTSASSYLKPGSFGLGESVNLLASANLDSVQFSGFYRLQNGYDASFNYGQMIVSKGGDTMLQLLAGSGGRLVYRTGTVGAGGALSEWRDLTPTFGTKDTTPGRSIKNGDRQTIAAWVNFFGNGSITIRGQYGISSVTRVQQGVYDIWFSTPFANDWYNVQALSGRGTSVGAENYMVSVSVVSPESNKVRIEVVRESNGIRTHTDSEHIYVTVIGALNNTPGAP